MPSIPYKNRSKRDRKPRDVVEAVIAYRASANLLSILSLNLDGLKKFVTKAKRETAGVPGCGTLARGNERA